MIHHQGPTSLSTQTNTFEAFLTSCRGLTVCTVQYICNRYQNKPRTHKIAVAQVHSTSLVLCYVEELSRNWGSKFTFFFFYIRRNMACTPSKNEHHSSPFLTPVIFYDTIRTVFILSSARTLASKRLRWTIRRKFFVTSNHEVNE